MVFHISGVLTILAFGLISTLAYPAQAESQPEIVFWQSIENSEDPRDFEDYLDQYPDGQFQTLAQQGLDQARIAAKSRALLGEYGIFAMITAAVGSDIEVMKWLKANGTDINAQIFSNIGLMHIAAARNNTAIMEWLKTEGIEINARDSDHSTPMHIAAKKNAMDAMKWLETQGADINVRGFADIIPMHSAAQGNAVNAMAWLKTQGADINAQDIDGYTPMHYAISSSAMDAVKWLKANGGRE